MTDLYLVQPDLANDWYPFTDCRPISELRAGAWLLRERWEAIAEGETRAVFGPPHLHGFADESAPSVAAAAPVTGPALIGLATFAPSGVRPDLPRGPARLTNDGAVVGWWVPAGTTWRPDAEFGADEVAIEGLKLHGSYDLVTALEYFLVADTTDFTHEGGDALPDGSILIGDPIDAVVLGAAVEPGVVFDVRHGPVVIEQHTHVKSGTRLEGPLYIGPGCEVFGGQISHCSIGPRCKIRGELAFTVAIGYANKAHDGFVGHSVLGRWVNIGAGTTTSNLKNTYGGIRLQIGDQRIETGRQNLGTLFGDHAKTAIGTQFDTGAVVGVGANVFGWTRVPKYVPPFAWGDRGVMRRDGFLDIAARVMPRREVTVTEQVRETLGRIYDHAVSA